MDFEEIKTKNVAELRALLNEQANLLRELRFKFQNQQLKTVNKISQAKKTVARINTVLSAKKKESSKK